MALTDKDFLGVIGNLLVRYAQLKIIPWTLGVIFTTLYFLHNLRMGPES
jgi:hypothetical protein